MREKAILHSQLFYTVVTQLARCPAEREPITPGAWEHCVPPGAFRRGARTHSLSGLCAGIRRGARAGNSGERAERAERDRRKHRERAVPQLQSGENPDLYI